MMIVHKVRRNGTVDILIVLAEGNIERIKHYDPAEIMWDQMPAEVSQRRPHTIGITFATQTELDQIERDSAIDPDWKRKAFDWLTRGFNYRPEMGDHDFGPIVLGEPTKGPKQ
jgi:hypothetical protein